MKNLNLFSCLALLCFFSLPGRSEITNVSAAPTILNVNINSGSISNLVWTVTLSENDALSREGEFLRQNSGGVLERVSQIISISAPTNSSPQPVSANESLAISADQAQVWWSLNIRQLSYRRTFIDGRGSSRSAVLTINLIDNEGSIATQRGLSAFRSPSDVLQIDRIELRFIDDTSVRFVEQYSLLQAKLAVSYRGLGTLRGFWQVADSIERNGGLLFRNLALVNEQLSALQQSEILSPILPTGRVGRYYLRFCVTEVGQMSLPQNANIACPSEIISTTVGYQISPEKQKVSLIRGIKPDTPFVKRNSVFNWPKVQGSSVYQLQILQKKEVNSFSSENKIASDNLVLVRGMLLPSSINETPLSDYVLSSLKKGELYFWRVSSYDSNGKLLAQSKTIPIQIN